MTANLLIFTVILIVLSMVLPIIITLIISKESKEKHLFIKLTKGISITEVIIFVILFSLWVTPIKNNELYFKEDEVVEKVSLSDAGFNELTMDDYLSLLNGSEKSIILVAKPTCGYCEEFAPILKQAMEDMNLTINYINTDDFSYDDWEVFNNSVDYLKNEEWGTPLVLIVQNGISVAENSGYVQLDTIKKFFKDNGLGE